MRQRWTRDRDDKTAKRESVGEGAFDKGCERWSRWCVSERVGYCVGECVRDFA